MTYRDFPALASTLRALRERPVKMGCLGRSWYAAPLAAHGITPRLAPNQCGNELIKNIVGRNHGGAKRKFLAEFCGPSCPRGRTHEEDRWGAVPAKDLSTNPRHLADYGK